MKRLNLSEKMNGNKRKSMFRNVIIILIVLVLFILICAFLTSRLIRKNLNKEFKAYFETVTMAEGNAESELAKTDRPEVDDCRLSIRLSKALSFQGLGETQKAKQILGEIDEDVLQKTMLKVVDCGIPYAEVQSYIMLSDGNLKLARKYFEQYIAYCDNYSFNARKLRYIDRFTKFSQEYGYNNLAFVQKYNSRLLDMYREELELKNAEHAKILLDTYKISAENVLIRSSQRMY